MQKRERNENNEAGIDLVRLQKEQAKLARLLRLQDETQEIRTVAGCDVAYTGRHIVCAIVVMDLQSLKTRESRFKTGTTRFPYLPGFLSYREAPIIIDTYHDLEIEPDILLVDGNGILHPRRFGLASHVGLSLDRPSIGVAKSLLCGEVAENSVVLSGETVARVLDTREKAKPIYVSPGHRVSLQKAVEVVRQTLREHKLPEPLHEAHKVASKVRRRLRQETKGIAPANDVHR